MPTTQVILIPPPLLHSNLEQTVQKWLLTVQGAAPLRKVDTSTGSYAEDLPPAGLNPSTGQSNQDVEITFVKTSADANTFTLNGAQGGPYTLTNQYQSFKVKSDGVTWWKSGCCPGVVSPPPVQ